MSPTESEKISNAYRSESRKLLGFIRKRISTDVEAEDILQDVFYQLTVGFRDLEKIRNLTSWLYTVAGNRITDFYRKKKHVNINYSDQATDGEEGPLSLEEILPYTGFSPEDEELRDLIWEKINETLNDLPPEQSEVFIATEFEDLSFREISEKNGIGVNTLISRKRYAVLELRKRLDELYKLFNYK